MTRLMKSVLAATLALTLGAVGTASAEEAAIPDEHIVATAETYEGEISILCVGNSILNHGTSESIGWFGSWGMAASSADKDYFHLLQKTVSEAGYENVKWSQVGLANFERAIDKRTDYDYASEIAGQLAPSVDKAKPDVVIFQIGENVSGGPTRKSYTIALTKMAEYCKKVNPDVQIIFCMPFWGGAEKCGGAKDAAVNLGFTYADLSSLNYDEYKAIGLFEHSGVASHPGDKGMEMIAKLLYEQLDNILYKKYIDSDAVLVKVDGKYVQFDVRPMLINDRTMIPIRAVSEALGCEVSWDDPTETATIIANGTKVTIKIGEKFITKNGEKIEIDVPAQLINDRTLVPLRCISEAIGCKVDWDDPTQTALVSVEEAEVKYPAAIVNDTCESLALNGYYGSSSKLSVMEEEGEHGKYINVNCISSSKCWNYIWGKMDLEPGKTYVVEFDVRVLKDYQKKYIESAGIGVCLHYDGKDNGIGVKEVKAEDGWTHVKQTATIPADVEKRPGSDCFGIYSNPTSDNFGVSFDVDNINVTVDGEVPTLVKEEAKEQTVVGGFVAGNGFYLINDGNVAEGTGKVTVVKTADGTKISHGGYYQTGDHFGGAWSAEKYDLDGLEVKIRYDKVPEVDEKRDCWIAIDFVAKPKAFYTNNEGNQGIEDLIRFGGHYIDCREASKEKNWATIYQSGDDASDDEKRAFSIKTGDTVTVKITKVSDGVYKMTYTNGKTTVELPAEFNVGDVMPDGKAYVLLSASCKASKDNAFEYTVLSVKNVK